MFLNMDILVDDLPQWSARTHIRDYNTSRSMRYVIPAGTLALNDPHALYALSAPDLPNAVAKLENSANILCIGQPDTETLRESDAANILIVNTAEENFDQVLKDCAEVFAWYADGFTQLTEAASTGDAEAMHRIAALLQYCLQDTRANASDPSALAEQLDLLLHRNITSWQLLEDTIADWKWDLLDEYMCIAAMSLNENTSAAFTMPMPHDDANFPSVVCLPQESGTIFVVNLTRYNKPAREAAQLIANEFTKHCPDAQFGVSNPFSELQDLYYYGEQAKIALQLGNLQKANAVCFFQDCFLDFVAQRCLEVCPPTALFPPGYSRLRNLEHGRAHKGSLVHFLHTYIENDFQMKPTVAAEFCSRTTAFEKLRKIKQITGMDLDDPSTRAALRIATRAIKLSKLSPKSPANTPD